MSPWSIRFRSFELAADVGILKVGDKHHRVKATFEIAKPAPPTTTPPPTPPVADDAWFGAAALDATPDDLREQIHDLVASS